MHFLQPAWPDIPVIATVPEYVARCIAQQHDLTISEPPFEPKLAAMLISGTSAKAGMLDAEGVAFDPGPALYFTLMRQLADNLVGCLTTP